MLSTLDLREVDLGVTLAAMKAFAGVARSSFTPGDLTLLGVLLRADLATGVVELRC